MKKGLSILLVAAALFGFYGGAVNLNDVLACKDYWEKAGEESTANMNKLEDGLNQLKDNEQAYLDGKDQVADGEVQLADAEKQLADGEKQLADGRKELAKGEADYAAAPAKLADARKQIAAGEAALSDGKSAINGLTKLINGIKKIRNGYNNDWKTGYNKLKDGREKLSKGVAGAAEGSLLPLAAFLQDKPDMAKAYMEAVNGIAKDNGKQTAGAYNSFVDNTNTLGKALPVIQSAVKTADKGANALAGALEQAKDSNLTSAGIVYARDSDLLKLAAFITDSNDKQAFEGAVKAVSAGYKQYESAIKENIEKTVKSETAKYMASAEGKAAVAQYMAAGLSQEEAAQKVVAAYAEKATPTILDQVKKQVAASAQSNATLTQGVQGILGGIKKIAAGLDAVNAQVNGKDSVLNTTLLPGLKEFNKATAADKSGKTAVEKLSEGQDTVAGGVATVASAVLGNKTLKAGVKKNFGTKAIALLTAYKSKNGPLSTSLSDFATFAAQMEKTPGVDSFLLKAQKLLAKTRADGLKTYNAGKKKLDSGKAQYAKGLSDYKAAPAKLAAGRKQLADGEAELAAGYDAYNEGQQTLADGKAQLAQYEDGEQQVRDGLATLTGTEADLDLESILDRLNGDDDFDNGDEHLDIDEGLAAVEVGRGYQAEDGVLITKEITARAVGTGALLGAGVLAVLAAILSFLKKNKGAGVFAILAAAAGAFGAYYGTNAGTYFSDIAGSTAGNAGWVAAGILGAIALVHAIAHFTANKEA